jgi:hypothetical protein
MPFVNLDLLKAYYEFHKHGGDLMASSIRIEKKITTNDGGD